MEGNSGRRSFNFYGEIDIPKFIMEFVSIKEESLFAMKTIRDVALFTDKKILICDKQGITGEKTEYYAIPYKSIVTFSVETVGHFDM